MGEAREAVDAADVLSFLGSWRAGGFEGHKVTGHRAGATDANTTDASVAAGCSQQLALTLELH